MIPQSTIQEVLDTAIIEEVIGEFVHLKKKGSTYVGLSPFTDEKSPSFHVSPSKRIFKCFSSGKGGNVISFIMEHEQYSYPEAIRFLAKKYGIEVPEEKKDDSQIQEEKKREALFGINNFALEFFTQQLHETDEGKSVGLSYFRERGFTDETIKKFQLGYCSSEWEGLVNAADEKKYKKEYLVELGLIKHKNGKYFDFFRERVIFPILSITGRPIAFAGRTLKTDKKIAKYINSSESEVYNKSKSLYGLNLAKNEIVKQDNCYLVEGYTDVISLHQSGIENVVASSGTSLTKEQIFLIRRYTKNITILYDGDEAGIKASFRGIDLILEEGMNVNIVLFPEGNDPDSFAREHSLEEIDAFLNENSRDFINFKIQSLQSEKTDNPIKKAELVREIIQTIAKIPDHIVRSVFTKEASSKLEIAEQTIINEINKLRRKEFYKDKKAEERAAENAPQEKSLPAEQEISTENRWAKKIEYLETILMQKLLEFGKEWIVIPSEEEEDVEELAGKYIIEQLEVDEIKPRNPVFLKIYELYAKHLKETGTVPAEDYFIHHQDSEISTATVNLISNRYAISENWRIKHRVFVTTESETIGKSAQELIYNFKLLYIEEMFDENQARIKENRKNTEKLLELMQEQKNILDMRKQFSKLLKRTFIK